MGTHNMGKGKQRKRLNVNYPKGNHKGQTLRPAGKGATSRRMTNLQASQKTGDTCRRKKPPSEHGRAHNNNLLRTGKDRKTKRRKTRQRRNVDTPGYGTRAKHKVPGRVPQRSARVILTKPPDLTVNQNLH